MLLNIIEKAVSYNTCFAMAGRNHKKFASPAE